MSQQIQGHMGIAQLDGHVIDRDSGNAGPGTIRVIEADDSPLSTLSIALDALNPALATLSPILDDLTPHLDGIATSLDNAFAAATPFHLVAAGLTEDKTVVKNAAGVLKYVTASNVNASPCYLKFYDKATAPAVASDTPVAVYLIPGSTAGGVREVRLPPEGMAFVVGIAFVIVTGAGNTDATEVAAGEVVVSGTYR